MGTDAINLKQQFDMRDVVQQSLGPPTKTKPSESTFPCPFHDEKTVGGFHVWADGYRCFSCGAQGDIFTWYSEHEYMSFKDTLAKLNGGQMPETEVDPVKLAKALAEKAERQQKALQEEIVKAQEVVETLEEGKKWLQYHANLDQISEDLWKARGVTDKYWMDYWNLGYNPEFKLWDKTGDKWTVKHTSPTLTIPVFAPGWGIQNIKHRLLIPGDFPKYMQEKRGVKATTFIADPDMAGGKTAIVVEGEIKAMVTFLTYDDPNMQVFGLPAATPEEYAIQALREYDEFILVLDPDTYQKKDNDQSWNDVPIMRLADMLSREKCRHVRLPEKVDDMIVDYDLDKFWLRQQVGMARPFKPA